ncbi:hypothetical protein [Terriglobus sp.]|uniref:hypothetical protein n=1 Tax=Terriglobus sp. TaxID=1889013 RepID=UPI003B009576
MQLRSWKSLLTATVAALLPSLLAVPAFVPLPAAAQATASNPNNWPFSRVDIFAGYSYLKPVHANVGTANEAQPITTGAAVSVAGYFNNFLGAELQGTYHPSGPNDCVTTVQGGLIARYQVSRLVPFVHALGGGARTGGPDAQPCGTWGHGYTAGLGFDYILHSFHDHLAVRPIEADYNYNHVDYGPFVPPGNTSGGLLKMNAYSLSAGLVVRFGDTGGSRGTNYGAALACTANPGVVNAGDPVTITSSNTGLDAKKRTTYTWTTTGGKLSGSGETVQVATEGLAPGTYSVNGRVMQGGRAYQQATCRAEFEVSGSGTTGTMIPATKAAVGASGAPPTISCAALPSTIRPGDSTTITSTASSPGDRPLTYSYSTSAGQITGQGASAMLNSGGAAPGDIVVTCSVASDTGQTASATTIVQVVSAPAPPAPSTRSLCSIGFERDKRRPVRVDNEAKGCLDDIALTMQREGDSELVMIGNNATGESADMAAERAANAKLYLTREKGIDPGRITLRTGQAGDRSVNSTLIPAGATFDDTMSVAVNEGVVQHSGEAYGVPRTKTTRRTRRR